MEDPRPSVGPEGGARGRRVEHEQIEVLPDPTMVSFARLFETGQVRLEILLFHEGRAVDALEHLALLVTSPVSAGAGQELEVLEPSRAGYVRPPAQIEEGTVLVYRDDLVLVELLQSLQLEGIVRE